MDKWKWSQIICTAFLALLPIGFEYRNSKYPDRRTNIYHRITGSLFGLWVIACLGLAIVMYHDFSKEAPSPKLSASLNGMPITNNCTLAISYTNEFPELRFVVLNEGEVPADGVKLTLLGRFDIRTPHQIQRWQPLGMEFAGKIDPKIDVKKIKAYRYEMQPDQLDPHQGFWVQPIELLTTNVNFLATYGLQLYINAKLLPVQQIDILLRITNLTCQATNTIYEEQMLNKFFRPN